jgi:dehydrogenase/reductase SDR family protein 12
LRDHVEEIRERGAELVVIGNGAPNFATAFREDFGLEGPLLLDPDLLAYRAAGLRRGRVEILSPRVPANALRAMAAGARQESVQGDPWQLGGVLMIRSNGDLGYRHISREAGDHAPIEEVLDALDDPGIRTDELPPTSSLRRAAGKVLSTVIDPLIVPSFDRTGFRIHALTFDPEDLNVDLADRHCVITGANSGIGYETALALADLGAEVTLVCRDESRGEAAVDAIRSATGSMRVSLELADISDLDSVCSLAGRLLEKRVDVLIHNAGVLPNERQMTRDGLELTFATHVMGPFLLTSLLRSHLEESDSGRVIWVTSGGMYTTALNLADPNWDERAYDGVAAYAETKRAQTVLAELWADEFAGSSVVVNAMHPGWADTPSVRESLPNFYRATKSILRTAAEAADTVVWLAASARAGKESGELFFDRRARSKHLLPFTRETAGQRQALWDRCVEESFKLPEKRLAGAA